MNYEKILGLCKSYEASLLAVSKYAPDEAVARLAALGQVDFGENKVQDLVKRSELFSRLFTGLSWQLLGPLQSNKINALIRAKPALWQSCSSLKEALAVEQRLNGPLSALLQVKINAEINQKGCDIKEAFELFAKINSSCSKLKLRGLMAIGLPFDKHSQSEAKAAFLACRAVFEKLQNAFSKEQVSVLSMGMSDDYRLALDCGSTQIRLGSALFKGLI